MFKFGFSQDACQKDSNNDEETTKLSWFSAAQIKVTSEETKKKYPIEECMEIVICDTNIKIRRSENVLSDLKSEDHENIVKAESQHSDLLPAIYEGGLKIWECTHDMGNYLIESGIELKGKKILDLGCGAGVIGILTLLKGSIVHFQDYNEEVIRSSTIPNVLLNFEEPGIINDKCEFYSGDWESFIDLSSSKYSNENEKFDIIVTSETIYNPANHKKLYEVFKHRLSEKGVGYVAGKIYYFGVGGGMRQFETLVREDRIFDVETVWKSLEVAGLQREIIKLQRLT